MSRGLWFAMSARTRRSLTLLWTALFLCSLALQSIQLAAPVSVLAVHDEPVFELDGNATDSATDARDDWQAVFNNTDVADASVFITDAVAERSFTGGGSKDDLNTNQWLHTAQSVPDKDDIQHAFAAVYGDLLYYGGDRFQVSGDAQIGFWFFKNGINVNVNGTFSPVHTVGDLLVLSHFSNGGTVSTIELYEWVGIGGDTNGTLDLVASGAICTTAPADDIACAIANAADSPSPWPYTPKSGAANVFGANAFFEGGLDLADVYNGNPPCFSSFLVETRSSTSIGSTLQDFAAGAFNTCVPPTITTQSSTATADFGATVTDTATLSGNDGPASGTVSFFICTPAQITGAGCPSGSGSQVGGAVAVATTLNGGTATSSAYTVGSTSAAVGKYCWRAEYTPDATSQYLAGSHTNATTECFTVAPAAIDIDKVANPAGPVNAGSPIGFDITVTNTGTGTALGVAVSDTLPGGVDWTLGTVTGGASCQINGAVGSEVLSCTKASLASGASFTVRVTAPTDATDCGTINNTGSVSTTNDGTDSDPASVVVQCPDVTVAKTPDGGSVNAGDTATFTIVVTNLGPGSASNVTLTDNLPAGYTWTLGGVNAASCSIDTVPNPDVLSCAFGTLADDATRTITLSAPTSGASCAVIPNTAVVGASNEPTSANGNNSDPGSIDVLCAVIDIDKVASPVGPVSAGDEIGFDIIVTNTGDGTATTVVVTDNLPAGIVWTADLPTGDVTGVSCSINTAPNPDVLTCTDASMAQDDTFTVHIHGITDAADCGTVTNIASVTTGNDGEDSEDATVQVLCPDVTVVKTADNSPINAGDTAAYTITVSNAGPGVAKGVTLSDPLPAGISWSEDSPDCSINTAPNPDVLNCTFGDLDALASKVVHLTGLTDSADCTTLPNTATVAATNEALAQQSNNTSSASIVVECPDITVLKSGNGPISAGQVATFTIVLSNAGPGDAYGVTLNDQLPSGVWTLGGADAAACSISGTNLLTCAFGTVLAATGRTITVSKTSVPADCSSIPNTVTVAATNEAATSNNSSQASIVVNCPDLEVVKDGNGPISAGENAIFTITLTNRGPGAAFDVVLTDNLPAGIVWNLGGADAAACSINTVPSPDVLTCDFGTLNANANAIRTITLTGETDAPDCGTIPNTASAVASNEDTATDQYANQDSASIVVNCPLIVITKSADDAVVNAGDQIGFTVTVTNTGAGSAFGVTVLDTLPPGLTWTESPDMAGWSITGGVLSFGPATLPGVGSAPANAISVHIVATTDAADCGTVPNTAFLTYTGGTGDDAAEVDVQCPDITVIKSGNGPILNGAIATFTITLTNQGPGDSYDTTLTDQLPAGAWTLGGPDAADCAISLTNLLTCDFGTVEAPESESSSSRTITVSKTAVTADCGTIPNEVTVFSSNEDESDTDNNNDSATIAVRCPDTDIVKTANDDLVEPGQVVTFTLNVQVMQGPVTNAVVTDTLPVGQTYVVGSAVPAPFSVSADGRSIIWKFASLATGNPSVTITYDIKIDSNATAARQVNVAQICVAETSVDCDSDDEDVTPQFPALLVIKTAGASAASQAADGATYATETFANNVTYKYVVTNTGQIPLNGITLSDDNGTASGADDFAVSCPKSTLVAGESMTCTATRTIAADRTNIATATGFTTHQPTTPVSDTDDAKVVIQAPLINLVKTAGNAADGATFITEPGNVTYTYKVTNTGPLALSSVTVRDDAGTPANTADDFSATCPKTTLAPAESMTCTFTVSVVANRTNIAIARGVTVGGNSVQDDDAAVVRILTHGLLIDKTNSAPIVTLLLPNGSTLDTPTAKEGTTVTYTLAYAFAGDPVSNAIITDVLPVGVTYVAGSASSVAPFTFQGYNAGTRTLTWTAATVAASGSVSYRATINVGASELPQPLVNVAAIDSDQTARDDDDSRVFVPTVPLAATATPKPTLPPTDVLSAPQGTSNPGFTLMLILLVLAAVVLVVGFVTPVPASVRERSSRR